MDRKYETIRTGDWGRLSKLPDLRAFYHTTLLMYEVQNNRLNCSVSMYFPMNFIHGINASLLKKGKDTASWPVVGTDYEKYV